MKKTVRIDELLSWAFVHELPKGGGVDGLDSASSTWRMLQASSWGKVSNFAELLTLVDVGWRDHDNFLIEQGEPHEDALAVGAAVADLVHCDVVFPGEWFPLGDWQLTDPVAADLARQAVARARERFALRPGGRRMASLIAVVIGTAVLARQPDWTVEQPKVRMVERGGKPAWFVSKTVTDGFGRSSTIEVEGYNRRAQRPLKGAYRRHEFSIDPVGDILARLDWQLWIAALSRLHGDLADQLVAHRLVPMDETATPWAEGGVGVELVRREGPAKKTATRC